MISVVAYLIITTIGGYLMARYTLLVLKNPKEYNIFLKFFLFPITMLDKDGVDNPSSLLEGSSYGVGLEKLHISDLQENDECSKKLRMKYFVFSIAIFPLRFIFCVVLSLIDVLYLVGKFSWDKFFSKGYYRIAQSKLTDL